jgi:hypothetical protein
MRMAFFGVVGSPLETTVLTRNAFSLLRTIRESPAQRQHKLQS